MREVLDVILEQEELEFLEFYSDWILRESPSFLKLQVHNLNKYSRDQCVELILSISRKGILFLGGGTRTKVMFSEFGKKVLRALQNPEDFLIGNWMEFRYAIKDPGYDRSPFGTYIPGIWVDNSTAFMIGDQKFVQYGLLTLDNEQYPIIAKEKLNELDFCARLRECRTLGDFLVFLYNSLCLNDKIEFEVWVKQLQLSPVRVIQHKKDDPVVVPVPVPEDLS